MKKIIFFVSFLVICLNANNLYDEPNPASFKNGFNAGINSVAFQAKIDGFYPQIINITKPYVVAVEIKNMSLDEALFLQIIANREGFDTHLTTQYVTFGEYQREIDAKKIVNKIKADYKIKSSEIKILKDKKQIITYPFLFSDFYTELLKEAKANGVIESFKIIEVKPQVVKKPAIKSVKKQTEKTKTISFKNSKAMSYSLSNNDESNSKNLNDNELKSGKYTYEKIITTKQGEKFVKVKGENLYFSILDVVIGE
ncbi:hypothetical protein LMG7974_01611 [Campylobacter majalis]|uniref:Periplasmic protein n=1 Tax=Campylobacter majalis TaxID=2790656 RepID=A0ABM8Q971_9BACT|nr:hypothetical protein [Campylobacter majalis]CAD7289534.1 hypothetical protein LMG7974_01611 [Campylobacter majalis]